MKKLITAGLLVAALLASNALAVHAAVNFPTPAHPAYVGDPWTHDQSALSTNIWTNNGSLPTEDQIEITSGFATTTCSVECDGQAVNTVDVGENQFVSINLHNLTKTGVVFLYANEASNTSLGASYSFALLGPANGVNQAANFTLWQADSTGAIIHNWAVNAPTTVSYYTQIALVVDHTAGTIAYWKDGAVAHSYNLSDSPGPVLTGHFTGIQLGSEATVPTNTDVGVTNFLAGPITTP